MPVWRDEGRDGAERRRLDRHGGTLEAEGVDGVECDVYARGQRRAYGAPVQLERHMLVAERVSESRGALRPAPRVAGRRRTARRARVRRSARSRPPVPRRRAAPRRRRDTPHEGDRPPHRCRGRCCAAAAAWWPGPSRPAGARHDARRTSGPRACRGSRERGASLAQRGKGEPQVLVARLRPGSMKSAAGVLSIAGENANCGPAAVWQGPGGCDHSGLVGEGGVHARGEQLAIAVGTDRQQGREPRVGPRTPARPPRPRPSRSASTHSSWPRRRTMV